MKVKSFTSEAMIAQAKEIRSKMLEMYPGSIPIEDGPTDDGILVIDDNIYIEVGTPLKTPTLSDAARDKILHDLEVTANQLLDPNTPRTLSVYPDVYNDRKLIIRSINIKDNGSKI